MRQALGSVLGARERMHTVRGCIVVVSTCATQPPHYVPL